MKKNSMNKTFLMLFLLALIPIKNQAKEASDYNTPDYYFNYPSSSRPNPPNRFSRNLEGEDYFSSGISSYQGTSTGPGPNGGYPGSPKGIYPTRYVDTSVYPNSYMDIQSR